MSACKTCKSERCGNHSACARKAEEANRKPSITDEQSKRLANAIGDAVEVMRPAIEAITGREMTVRDRVIIGDRIIIALLGAE